MRRSTPCSPTDFGDVAVYFDQVDVPLPLVRTRADAADVEAWLQGLLQAFAPPILYQGLSLHVGASIGCALVPEGVNTDVERFQHTARVADVGMYQAKAEGRGRAVWLRLTEAGVAAWPWHFAITPGVIGQWQAKGWVQVQTILPPESN